MVRRTKYAFRKLLRYVSQIRNRRLDDAKLSMRIRGNALYLRSVLPCLALPSFLTVQRSLVYIHDTLTSYTNIYVIYILILPGCIFQGLQSHRLPGAHELLRGPF